MESIGTLDLANNKITDFSPLIGISIGKLNIGGNPSIKDYSFLQELKVESVVLTLEDEIVRAEIAERYPHISFSFNANRQ